jgi:hypothetical protein
MHPIGGGSRANPRTRPSSSFFASSVGCSMIYVTNSDARDWSDNQTTTD